MATAKLWWNGSAWKATESLWVDVNTIGGNWYGVAAKFKIIAYDDATIKFNGQIYGVWGNNNWVSGSQTIKADGNTIGGFSMSDTHSQTVNATISSPTATVTYSSARFTVWGNDGTRYSGTPWDTGGGSTTITTPFCTITYNANGGSDAPASQTVLNGITDTLSASTPTRANHTFLGWATSSSAHAADYSAGGSITVSSDTTLYAVWGPAVFISADDGATITFNGTDYTNTTATIQNLVYGNSYSVAITANTGFIIKTRSPASDGSVTLVDEQTFSATSQRVGCHIDDGDDFVQAVMYVDNGVSYDMVQAYVDNGVSWELVY